MLSALEPGQSNLRGFSSGAYRPLTRAAEDHAMRQMSRFKTATLMTALFVGGAAAGGVASQSGGGAGTKTQPTAATLPPKVIHKRKVRTVHVKPKASAAASTAPVSAAYVPASAPASYSPTHVTSSTSGGAGGAGGGGGEHEGGEHEKGD
jgi:hypothetical protein